MSLKQDPIKEVLLPCSAQPDARCKDCILEDQLMCRFNQEDMLNFFMIVFPYAFTVISGAIRAGYGLYLLLWLAYSLFFFFIWESRVLCRHCPFWAKDSRILNCHANYGVVKIWKYTPYPMSKSEKTQFILGALLWLGFPFPFLLLGHEYLLTLIGLSAAVSGIFLLRRNICSRCINFSCPLNNVPKSLVDAYLKLNPRILSAWMESGYQPEDPPGK